MQRRRVSTAINSQCCIHIMYVVLYAQLVGSLLYVQVVFCMDTTKCLLRPNLSFCCCYVDISLGPKRKEGQLGERGIEELLVLIARSVGRSVGRPMRWRRDQSGSVCQSARLVQNPNVPQSFHLTGSKVPTQGCLHGEHVYRIRPE